MYILFFIYYCMVVILSFGFLVGIVKSYFWYIYSDIWNYKVCVLFCMRD